jgi:hypothetical protein
MKHFKAALLFLFITLAAHSQGRIGNGIVSIDYNNTTIVTFYTSATDTKPVKTLEFFNDEQLQMYTIKNLKEHQKWLQPQSIWLDYGYFQFRCLGEQNGRYNVIINNETGLSYWMATNSGTEYVAWEAYLKSMFSVERITGQEIYTEPDVKSDTVPYKGTDCFVVKAMRGEWIEVYTDDRCDDGADKPTRVKSGWIRWRNGDEILVSFHPTS